MHADWLVSLLLLLWNWCMSLLVFVEFRLLRRESRRWVVGDSISVALGTSALVNFGVNVFRCSVMIVCTVSSSPSRRSRRILFALGLLIHVFGRRGHGMPSQIAGST
jgi:hypothetical protein